MTVLSGQTIRKLGSAATPIIEPFCERGVFNGMSYGLSVAGYDVRISETIIVRRGEFVLASTLEKFHMPNDVIAFVHDKSTWARMGLAVQNTVIEPGWSGYLTIELTNHHTKNIVIEEGCPVAQIIFHKVDEAVEKPYNGKYQDQAAGPQPAKLELYSEP